MDALYCLRDMLHTELDNVVNSSQGNIPLDIVDKITHSLKSVETIIAMKEGNEYKNNNYANNKKTTIIGNIARHYSRKKTTNIHQ